MKILEKKILGTANMYKKVSLYTCATDMSFRSNTLALFGFSTLFFERPIKIESLKKSYKKKML